MVANMKKIASYFQMFMFLVLTHVTLLSVAQTVRMETVLGNIDIQLHADSAPNTVANFLRYVNDDDYNNSYIHRSVPGFIIQGGGFTSVNGVSGAVPVDAPIALEANLSNVRGTIAMARGTNINSATSQWFFNLADNTNLDGSNGYAVFGTVVNGMDVVDAIAALPVSHDFAAPIDEIPLINYTSGNTIMQENLVIVTDVYELSETLHINPGLNGAWFNAQTSGQGITLEVLPNLNSVFMAWFTFDTQNPAANTTANIGYAGHRWLTSLGSINNNVVTFDLTNTSGGLFDNPQAVSNSPANSYGSMTITFASCSLAHVTYSLTQQQLTGSFDMRRITPDNVALCESLSAQAEQKHKAYIFQH